MVFNSSKFLQSQGWEGSGSALRKGGRARPVSVVQKKTLAGVGKDTYNGFEWWDAVFAGVAKKLNKTGTQPVKEHRTSTGILSPLPPPITHSEAKASTSTDYIGQAKQEAAKARLYRGFLRGQVLEGNLEDEQKAESIVVEVIQPQKEKKRRRTRTDDGEEREETKEERRARRALKKAAELGLAEDPASGSQIEALNEEKPRKKRRKTKEV